MAYLTLFVSELPVIPIYTSDQKIYVRAEVTVPDEFSEYPAGDAGTYLKSLAEVIQQDMDTAVKFTPQPEAGAETPSSD